MEIITESRNQNTIDIDLLPTREIIRKINNEDKLVALAVEDASEEIAQAVEIISKQFLRGGRLFYFGAGTSGRLGVLDASECPPTFSADPSMVQGIIAGGDVALKTAVEGAEDNYDWGKNDAEVLTKDDVAVVISASGNPKYLIGVLDKALEKGAQTIAVTCNSKGQIASIADVAIVAEVGAEVIAGSSRMKAGSAQKMILNMLTTASMIKIGKTYENFMIDVKASNEKLKDRAIRIVANIANVSYSKALETLLQTDWEIKTSIITLLKSVSIETARLELKKNCGVLRKVLKKIEV